MRAFIVACSLLVAGLALAQVPDRSTPMTSTEAARLVGWLEQAPLAEGARDVRSDLIDWAVETKDATITMCDVLGPIPNSDVPYGPELLIQAMLGNGARQIHNPESKGDELMLQLAGIESMLRAYERILEVDASARIAQYDLWLLDLKANRLAAELAPSIKEKCVGASPKA